MSWGSPFVYRSIDNTLSTDRQGAPVRRCGRGYTPIVVVPFLAMQKVEIDCPHCEHVNVRLATAVKRGLQIVCERCGKKFRVRAMRASVGLASPRRG